MTCDEHRATVLRMPLHPIDHSVRPSHVEELTRALERHRDGFLADPYPTAAARRDNLRRLERVLRAHRSQLVEAISSDFGYRPHYETDVLEVLTSLRSLIHARKRTRAWMRPQRHAVFWPLEPASARTHFQPLGVVGVIAPWNYPLYLAIAPISAALAAGNRVMVKPSELTPAFSALFEKIVAEAFPDGLVTVHVGGPDVAQAFSGLQFDHLFFTGSTSVGRLVHQAAAQHLVPVTLELGGKSPTVIDRGHDLRAAALSVVTGKMTNAGQTCVAPDHVFVHEDDKEGFVAALRQAANQLYPSLDTTSDLSSIISARHHARLLEMRAEVEREGGQVLELNEGREGSQAPPRRMGLTLLLDAPDHCAAHREEIFGPLLPIVTYRDHDEVITRINGSDRPLTLYVFTHDGRVRDRYTARTCSGSLVFNTTLVQLGVEELPFGGVGASGMGAYHGKTGFRTFSHARAIYKQYNPNAVHIVQRPPFGALGRWILDKILIGR